MEKMDKKSKFKDFLVSFGKTLLQELRAETNYYWYQMIACILVVVSVLTSFFVQSFAYVSFILLVGIIIASFFINKKSLFALNIIMFFLPFSSVMFIPNKGTSFYAIAVMIFVFCACVKWLIQVIKKEKSIEFKIFIPFAVLSAYLFLLFILKFYSVSFLASVITGTLFLFVIYVFRKEINFKDAVFSLIIGMLISCILGLFYDKYPQLSNYFNVTYALDTYRFSGLFPNTNAFSFNILVCLGIVGTLFVASKINILFYPLFLILLIISFSTISKMVILILLIYVPILILLKSIFVKGAKNKVVVISCILLTFLIAVIIQFDSFATMWKRIETPISNQPAINEEVPTDNKVVEKSEEVVVPETSDIPEVPSNTFASEFTTGRTDLWKNSLKAIFDEPVDFLIGHRHGSDYDIGEGNYQLGSPHNTYLQCVYHVGALGAILIGICAISIIQATSFKKFAKSGIVMLIMMILCFGSLDNFSYMGYIYISIVALGLIGRNSKVSEENKEIKKDENS